MRELLHKPTSTARTVDSVELPAKQTTTTARRTGDSVHSNAGPSRFAHNFSRIPVRGADAAPVEEESPPDTVDASSAPGNIHTSGSGGPPDAPPLSLAQKIKIFRYRRKLKKLQARTNLADEQLKREMDQRYQFEAWYYVPLGGANVTAVNAWSPISDLADAFALENVTEFGAKGNSETLLWMETADPLILDVAGTGTITATLVSNQEYPDAVSVAQGGTEVARATVKVAGEKFVFAYDAAKGEAIELTLESHPENVRNTENPTAARGGSVWAPSKFSIIVKRDSPPHVAIPMPRMIGPFSGSLREQLKKLKKAGDAPLVK